MENKRLTELLDRFFNNTCSAEEKAELMNLLNGDEHDDFLRNYIDKSFDKSAATHQLSGEQSGKILSAILSHQQTPVVSISKSKKWFWAAAAVTFLAIGSMTYLIFSRQSTNNESIASVEKPGKKSIQHDIAPGASGATLTLADGSVIVLDSAADGSLASQGSTNILKTGGEIRYVGKDGKNALAAGFNTIGTQRGKKFQLVLEDGTMVWLNAESSIRFPTSFEKDKRAVEITGEAYFEVAKNPNRPFTVSVNGMQVQVLGTHFNINAYDDEAAISTTLLEGSVKIVNKEKMKMLAPGQQAQLDNNGELNVLRNVNTSQVVAWKNDLFSFNNTDIKTLMRQLSRWYDADVILPANLPAVTFTGNISRASNLSAVLKMLALTEEISFTIEDKKVIVKM